MTGPNIFGTPGYPTMSDIKISNDDLQRIADIIKPRGIFCPAGICEIPSGKVDIRLGRLERNGDYRHDGYTIEIYDGKGITYSIVFQLFGKGGVTDVAKRKYKPNQFNNPETVEWTPEEISQILADIAKEGIKRNSSPETISRARTETASAIQQSAIDAIEAPKATDKEPRSFNVKN